MDGSWIGPAVGIFVVLALLLGLQLLAGHAGESQRKHDADHKRR